MSNKYTASKKGRTHGKYRERLEDRGVTRVTMLDPKLSDGRLASAKRS